MVAKRYRLCRLEVRKARHDRAGMFFRPHYQRALQAADQAGRMIQRPARPQAEIGHHLVIPGPGRVQAPRRLADDLLQPRLLLLELTIVLVLIILTGIHTFILGPRMSQAVEALEPDTQELPEGVDKMRSQMAIVSSVMGVISLLVLLAAVALRLGI